MEAKLTEKEIEKYRQHLKKLADNAINRDGSRQNNERCSEQNWRTFSVECPTGQQIYESFSDEELTDILKNAYKRLGFAPRQGNIFCVYRSYIKKRFMKWPRALHKAGLSYLVTKAEFTDENREKIQTLDSKAKALLHRVSERTEELGYPPAKKHLEEICSQLKYHFGKWSDVLKMSELLDEMEHIEEGKLIIDLEDEYLDLLQIVLDKADELERTPLKPEIDADVRFRLRERCGSWRNVLYQAGLEPLEGEALEQAKLDYNQRKLASDGILCRMKDLEPEYTEMLETVKKLTQKLGRAPMKEEVAPEIRKGLQERCGSWRNALYQIGISALSKQQNAQAKKQLRDKIKQQETDKRRMKYETGEKKDFPATRCMRYTGGKSDCVGGKS